MQPGVVYTTFHFPESGANVITTDNSDWATNCPEYKVTAVQVMPVTQPSDWQQRLQPLQPAAGTNCCSSAGCRRDGGCGRSMKRDSDALMPPGGARSLPVTALRAMAAPVRWHDWVADEVPVALEFNGISHAVMLATPADLEDFALGFSLSEGIARPDATELYGIDEVRSARRHHAAARHRIGRSFARLKDRRRTLAGRTGCGLCGAESLAQVMRPLPTLARDRAHRAGAAHCGRPGDGRDEGAAAPAARSPAPSTPRPGARPTATVALLREDVGRHNALDKLIGALARGGVGRTPMRAAASSPSPAAPASRWCRRPPWPASPLLAAVSAPTALAVHTAEAAGLTLVGFARGDDLVVYSHPERLTPITSD